MPDNAHEQYSEQADVVGQTANFNPPRWMSTEELEDELAAAAIADCGTCAEVDFARIDAFLAADRAETESEYRCSVVRLLSDPRPQVAELIGGPRKCE
jgi:hypothetical protein